MFIVSIYDGGYGDVNFYVNGKFISRDEIKKNNLFSEIFYACDNNNYDLACALIRNLYLVKTIIICVDGSIFIREY